MSAHVVLGIVAKPSRFDDGWILGRAVVKSERVRVRVVRSVVGSGFVEWLIRLRRVRRDGATAAADGEVVDVSMVSAEWIDSSGGEEFCLLSISNTLFVAVTPAVDTRSLRSAPTKPGVSLAKIRKSTSAESRRCRVKAYRIFSRAASSGTLRLISLLNRPARRRAGSRLSGRFVAAMIMTGFPSVFSRARSSRTGQHLSDNSLFHLSLGALAFRSNGIDLVDEHQTGCHLPGLVKVLS